MADETSKDPYIYPRSSSDDPSVLINLQNIRDPADAVKNERTQSIAASAKPVENFTADLNGLKAVHGQYFGNVYEWAGKTRAETITIDGRTIEQDPNLVLTKPPDFRSGHAGLAQAGLPEHLTSIKNGLDQSFQRGDLTKASWAKATADQVGAINHVHPFRDGNGRAMRGFIENSARQYGYEADTSQFSKAEWMQHSHAAMDHKTTDGLATLIAENTVATDRANDYVAEQGSNPSAELGSDAAEAQMSPDASKAPDFGPTTLSEGLASPSSDAVSSKEAEQGAEINTDYGLER